VRCPGRFTPRVTGGSCSEAEIVSFVVNPLAGTLSVITLIAAWALVTGALKILFAFKIKNLPARARERIAGLR